MASRSFELRELFHLVFLRLLAGRLAGRPHAVKGGICLRFFHRSPRFSEDIDFDVSSRVAVETLQSAVDSVLHARVLSATLAPWGLAGIEATRPKQTETVQRWKVALIAGESRLPTGIEFSRRSRQVDSESGIPDREILNRYRQPVFAAPYYGGSSLAIQKILALASPGRSAVRDLFDLDHLHSLLKIDLCRTAGGLKPASIKDACEKIETFAYNDFGEEVLPYLTADLQLLYSSSSSFERIKSETLKWLKEASS